MVAIKLVADARVIPPFRDFVTSSCRLLARSFVSSVFILVAILFPFLEGGIGLVLSADHSANHGEGAAEEKGPEGDDLD